MIRIGFMFLIAFVLALCGFFVILYLLQERLIFLPEPLTAGYRFDFRAPFTEHIVEIDGLKIDSLLFNSPTPAKSLVLYFHGNAGSLSSWGDVASEIVKRTGSDVWMIDYPGYGKSEGRIGSEAQLHRIAKTFCDLASEEAKSKNQKLVIYGRSIGTGVAAKVAAENSVGGLILESPYYSLATMAKRLFPWAPTFLLKYKFPLNDWLPNVHAPILILHGDRDTTIPPAQASRLATENAAHAEGLKFLVIKDHGHNDLQDAGEYWSAVKEMLL